MNKTLIRTKQLPIADCQLPIEMRCVKRTVRGTQVFQSAIGNWQSAIILILAIISVSGPLAFAAPSQDDILKSINQNVGSTTDFSKVIPWLIGGVALIILAVLYSNRRERIGPVSKVLNNPGKLLKEISRNIHLKKFEIKQLKMLADERELSSPLTLLLCPSVLAKSMRTRNPRIDRKVLDQLARRLRQESVPEEAVPK